MSTAGLGVADVSRRPVVVDVPAAAAAPGDFDDTFCENDSICFARISDFISMVKANALYGDASGVIGSFDVVLRVNLNGRSPRYTAKFIHDTGPALTIDRVQIQCVDGNGASLIDSVCGTFDLADQPRVDAAFDTYTSRLINTPPLVDEGPYHASIVGVFRPGGTAPRLIAPVRSEEWFCPTAGDRRCTFNF
ncbi:hypothetical protein BJF78_12880 [Pseudonocardia sp. CNS-139]|nr:hypothetical protein BJF78_12880 [Pseudonocardia sp. CNS-139]